MNEKKENENEKEGEEEKQEEVKEIGIKRKKMSSGKRKEEL